jgi:hypothetical protein
LFATEPSDCRAKIRSLPEKTSHKPLLWMSRKVRWSVEQAEGSIHDFQFDKNRVGAAVSADVKIKVDSGYQGIAAYHANSETLCKKSKNHSLSQEEKAFHRQLSRERVRMEHINQQIKVFKIMSERYRNRRKRHKLQMTLLCAIRNYEITHNSGERTGTI